MPALLRVSCRISRDWANCPKEDLVSCHPRRIRVVGVNSRSHQSTVIVRDSDRLGRLCSQCVSCLRGATSLAGLRAQLGILSVLFELFWMLFLPASYVLDPAFLATTALSAATVGFKSRILFRVFMPSWAMRLPGPCIPSRILGSGGRH